MSADCKSKSLLHFRSNWRSTYHIIPIFQYSGKTKQAYTDPLQGPAAPAVHNRRDEITLGQTRKKSRKSGNSDMLPGLALCAVQWIHSSIASRLHLLSEISRTELFDAFHGAVKNTTFWLIRGAHDSELATRTERGKRIRDQCTRCEV